MIVALLAALLLAACSSGNKHKASAPTIAPSTVPTPPPLPTLPPTPSPKATTAATPAATFALTPPPLPTLPPSRVPSATATSSPSAGEPDRCHTPGLSVSVVGSEGAAGTIHNTLALKNTSGVACTLYGYVGELMLDAQGQPLPTTVIRGQGTPSINDAPQQFTVQPGASATFVMEWSDVPHGNETTCPTSASLEVTPPDETAFLTLPLKIAPCAGGTIHVSPVRAPQ
jgi:hypothetical protein